MRNAVSWTGDRFVPRYIVTCAGSELYPFATKKAALLKKKALKAQYAGSGIFPFITLLRTEILSQTQVF